MTEHPSRQLQVDFTDAFAGALLDTLKKAGMPIAAYAERCSRYGVARSTVYRILNEPGWDPRGRTLVGMVLAAPTRIDLNLLIPEEHSSRETEQGQHSTVGPGPEVG
jgi:hypothetical protein